MTKYEIWMEGFLATGMEGVPSPAHKIGEASGNTFSEAVIKWYNEHPERLANFDAKHLADWGCKLFPIESEARASFG